MITSVAIVFTLLLVYRVESVPQSDPASDTDSPLVTISQGKLRGKILVSRKGSPYSAFLGIPYAESPERFKAPVPAEGWDGILEATSFGASCPQPNLLSRVGEGSEDCLFLNVYTPAATDGKRRPVIFYIHGGGFTYGSGDIFGAKYFMDTDVVLVTLNYRIGVLGFLNTKDGLVGGNMGLKDQVLGLHWVQKNIGNFGGDKDRVGIVGESAGGASVIYHILSPLSKGLFHAAITQTGTALNPWAFQEDTLTPAKEIGEMLNCPTKMNYELVDCLENKPLAELVGAQGKMLKWYVDPITPFSPSTEIKNSKNPEPFLTEPPLKLMQQGRFNKVPLIMTFNKDEGLLFHGAVVVRNEMLREDLNQNWDRVAPITFTFGANPEVVGDSAKIKIISDKIREFYFNNNDVSLDNAQNLTNLYTDALFLSGIHKTALLLAKFTPVYTGMFTYIGGGYSTPNFFGIKEVLGVAHGDELRYFYNPATNYSNLNMVAEISDNNVPFSESIVALWSKFAESRLPVGSLGSVPVNWNNVSTYEIQSNSLNFLNLNENPYVHIHPIEKRMTFWNKIYETNPESQANIKYLPPNLQPSSGQLNKQRNGLDSWNN